MSATTTATLGASVPPFTPHAISVSLPTWRDNVGYEAGEKRVTDLMVNGYPRFFIHLSIQKLARICEQKFGVNGERCLLCPTKTIAEHCRSFMIDRASKSGSPVAVRLVQFCICPEDKQSKEKSHTRSSSTSSDFNCVELHIVLFPSDSFSLAKEFWQHTGMGISSRLAERCLSMLPDDPVRPAPVSPAPLMIRPSKPANRHYSVKIPKSPTSPSSPVRVSKDEPDVLSADHSTYLEERYGRNLPITAGAAAKRALRRRIAGVLVRDSPHDDAFGPHAGGNDAELGPSSRGVNITEDDVYLYSTGITAIWSAHQLALGARPPTKSICFGFPYADTLKILQKWGPGCHFMGHGLDSDIDELSRILDEESASGSLPPALALFTEFPSNPLLRSADMPRLRALADKHDFLIVIDETVGNFVNVEILPYADVVVSSLTKIFSGDANVMGGSLVLNPTGRHYAELKAHMLATYEDFYFDEDAIYMERNSRDFKRRIYLMNENTEAVCDFLRAHSLAGGAPSATIKEVFYPKYITPHHYDRCRVKAELGDSSSSGGQDGGYGGLFSLTFTSPEASHAFFDTLPCYKGPSLGTNFTLACPYTVIAHYVELEWAALYGVEEGLVRVSVGLEDKETLLRAFGTALKAAQDATEKSRQ